MHICIPSGSMRGHTYNEFALHISYQARKMFVLRVSACIVCKQVQTGKFCPKTLWCWQKFAANFLSWRMFYSFSKRVHHHPDTLCLAVGCVVTLGNDAYIPQACRNSTTGDTAAFQAMFFMCIVWLGNLFLANSHLLPLPSCDCYLDNERQIPCPLNMSKGSSEQ